MANKYCSSSSENGSVRVFIYESELKFLKWLVLKKLKIETGGDLFGLWQDENTAVVQIILGPGKDCRRTTTSFHQDVVYLRKIGGYLTTSQGLCNIGEWHSHHTLGLAEPSVGDRNTVWNHLPSVAGGKFLVFIANIRGTPPEANIGCFLFNSRQQKMLRGTIQCLPCESPVRSGIDNKEINSEAEPANWAAFLQASMQIKERSPEISSQVGKQNSCRNSKRGRKNTKNKNTSEKDEKTNTKNEDTTTKDEKNNTKNENTSTKDDKNNTKNKNTGTKDDKNNTKNKNTSTKEEKTNTVNKNASTNNKKTKTKKGSKIINENLNSTNSNLSKPTSGKKVKKKRKQNKRLCKSENDCKEHDEMNEENHDEEEILIPVEEQESSKFGFIFTKLGQIITFVRNYFRRVWGY